MASSSVTSWTKDRSADRGGSKLAGFPGLWDVARFHPETEQGQAAADAADIVRTSSKKANGSAGDESAALAHENIETPDEVVNAATLPNDIELPAESETKDGTRPEIVKAAEPDAAGEATGDGNTEPPEKDAASVAAAQMAMVVGQVCGLMTASPAHRHLFVADLEWRLMPPVLLRQFSLIRKDSKLLAFVSWASVNDAADARLAQGNPRLTPKEWRSGANLWIMDVVSPFAERDAVMAQLRESLFKGRDVKTFGQGAAAPQ